MAIMMELIREKCCCFTGHRILSAQEKETLWEKLRGEILRLAGMGTEIFLAGGALGFDTLAAQEVLALREGSLPGIKLVLALPCLGQEKGWREPDIELYYSLMRRADEVIYTGDVYTKECMFLRNRYLVDHSSHCVCYLKNSVRGGTVYTVNYARKQGLEIINLADLPQLSFAEQ